MGGREEEVEKSLAGMKRQKRGKQKQNFFTLKQPETPSALTILTSPCHTPV